MENLPETNKPKTPLSSVESDEVIAKLLQAEFDQESRSPLRDNTTLPDDGNLIDLSNDDNEEEQNTEEITAQIFADAGTALKKSVSQTFAELFNKSANSDAASDTDFSDINASSPMRLSTPSRKPSNISSTPTNNVKSESRSNDEGSSLSFSQFLLRINKPDSLALSRNIKSFIREFNRRNMSPDDQSRIFSQFMNLMATKLRCHASWNLYGEEYCIQAEECIEKLVTSKLYTKIFRPIRSDDSLQDEFIFRKIFIHNWYAKWRGYAIDLTRINGSRVSFENLDIKCISTADDKILRAASEELLKLNDYTCPRDKLLCILNCSKLIYDYISTSGGDKGADYFVPIMVFVVIQANPKNLISNVRFISRFRRSSQTQKGEAFYYYTNLLASISFIEKISPETINVDPILYKDITSSNENEYLELLRNRSTNVTEKLHTNKGTTSGLRKSTSSQEFLSAATLNEFKNNLMDKSAQLLGKIFKDTSQPSSPVSYAVKGKNNAGSSKKALPQNARSSEEEERERFDYELQLAMALSLSENSSPQQNK